MPSVQTAKLTRKRASALHDLKALLRSRNIEQGRQIPPERELANDLPISRGLLRSLLDDLENAGAIRRVSARRRILVDPECEGAGGGESDAGGAMDGVIALLGQRETRWGGEPSALDNDDEGNNRGLAPANWQIQQHAMQRVIDAGYHALGVQYDRLKADGGRWLLSQRPAGLVALRGVAPSVLRRAVQIGIPAVAFGELNQALGVSCVASDHRWGAAELTRRAIRSGAKCVLPVWPVVGAVELPRPWLAQRELGYQDACKDAGIEALASVKVPCIWRGADVEQCFHHNARTIAGYLVERLDELGRPDVILATNDVAAFEIAEACRLLGVKPGEDLLIYGYDNYYQHDPYRQISDFIPSLTVDKRNEVVGDTLVDVLLQTGLAGAGISGDPQVTNTLVKPVVIDPADPTSTG